MQPCTATATLQHCVQRRRGNKNTFYKPFILTFLALLSCIRWYKSAETKLRLTVMCRGAVHVHYHHHYQQQQQQQQQYQHKTPLCLKINKIHVYGCIDVVKRCFVSVSLLPPVCLRRTRDMFPARLLAFS